MSFAPNNCFPGSENGGTNFLTSLTYLLRSALPRSSLDKTKPIITASVEKVLGEKAPENTAITVSVVNKKNIYYALKHRFASNNSHQKTFFFYVNSLHEFQTTKRTAYFFLSAPGKVMLISLGTTSYLRFPFLTL